MNHRSHRRRDVLRAGFITFAHAMRGLVRLSYLLRGEPDRQREVLATDLAVTVVPAGATTEVGVC